MESSVSFVRPESTCQAPGRSQRDAALTSAATRGSLRKHLPAISGLKDLLTSSTSSQADKADRSNPSECGNINLQRNVTNV